MPGYIDNLINDPTMVPLATETPNVFVTHDGTPIIVSSTLRNRSAFGRLRHWLDSPVRRIRGGGRP